MTNEELRRCVLGMVRLGTVMNVDNEKHKARVKFQSEDFTSAWLFVLDNRPFIPSYDGAQQTEAAAGGSGAAAYASHTHGLVIKQWMPKVNQKVLCLYMPTDDGPGDGYVLGGV